MATKAEQRMTPLKALSIAFVILWVIIAAFPFLWTAWGSFKVQGDFFSKADWTNALPISISETLFFKPAIQVLWRNDPSLTEVPLYDNGGSDTGNTVLVPFEKTDTFTSISLVVKI